MVTQTPRSAECLVLGFWVLWWRRGGTAILAVVRMGAATCWRSMILR
ncbi:MAG TPA: hypothetical protein PLO37_01100 [Candidatus Hydrogenedentes bacterium]|nr:hypothetical protein [Candidatus Hydrogenedentota bacterium]HPG65412.1 hypothetical protein [Candidatus Hydrogenedentota bacterium]